MYATHKSSNIEHCEDRYSATVLFVTYPMELPITLVYKGNDKKIINYLTEMQSWNNLKYPIFSLKAKLDLPFLRKLYTEEGKPILPSSGALRMLDGYILRFIDGRIIDNSEVTYGRKK